MKEPKIIKGWRRYIGLMFIPKSKAEPVMFEFEKDTEAAIHMFFVFFPCKLIWKDSDDNIIETRMVKPWQFNIRPDKPFRKLIEIPLIENGEQKREEKTQAIQPTE